VPDSWIKFRQIVSYWLDKGVDGFRYDMAEMVPVEFWSYLNSSIKMKNGDAFLLAEVYNPQEYRNYLQLGRMDYLAHFCPGPLWLAPVLVPVEIVGLFAKVFALTVRLFANMVAGHVMLAVLLSFILGAGSAMGAGVGFGIAVPVVAGSVALSLLEIFVALLQAYIFTFLTALFIGQSVNVHHDDHEEAHA